MSAESTPESFALGIDDVKALVGLTAPEIRARLESSADVALVEPRRGAPSEWPDSGNVVELDPAGGGTVWRYQRADGEWRLFVELPRERAASRPAFLYTRRPAASPFATVRPVVFVLFDDLGLCTDARAVWVDGVLRLAEDRTLPDLDERKPVRRLEPRSDAIAMEKVERILGLAPPLTQIEARDFGADVTGSLAIGYGIDPTGAGIAVLDADQRLRLAIRLGPDGEWLLNVHEDRGQWRAERLAPGEGLRVVIVDRSGRERRWLDVHAGLTELFWVEIGGSGRAVRLFLSHHRAPGLAPGLETDDVNIAAILSSPIPRPKIGGVPVFPRLQSKPTEGGDGGSLLAFLEDETRVRFVLPAFLQVEPSAALLLARGAGAAIIAAP